MRNMVLCAVLDAAVNEFSPPFCVRSTAEAVRSFGTAVNDSSTAFHQHPGDFALYLLGSVDLESGRLIPLDRPDRLVQASDVFNSGGSHEAPLP